MIQEELSGVYREEIQVYTKALQSYPTEKTKDGNLAMN